MRAGAGELGEGGLGRGGGGLGVGARRRGGLGGWVLQFLGFGGLTGATPGAHQKKKAK